MAQGPRILELKDFRNLWIGQTISQLGDSVYFLVFLFMAEKISGNAAITGLIAVVQALPFVLFSPLAGVAADRIDRRKLMLFSEYSSFVVMFVLFLALLVKPQPAIWMLGVSSFLLSTVNAFFMPARSAAIPRLVPKERIVEANGFAMASQQGVAMLGIAISASGLSVLYAISPDNFFRTAVIVNAVTFLGSAWFLRKLPDIAVEMNFADMSVRQIRKALKEILSDFMDGLRAIGKDSLSRVALPMNVFSTLSISGFFVAYVVVNGERYGGEFWTLALIEFAFAFVSLVCSIYVSRLNVKRPGMHFAFGIGFIGLMVVGMAFTEPYIPFLLLNAACGLAFPSLIIPISSYFQTAFPDELRGRVNSTWSMVSTAAQPLGIVMVAGLLTLGVEQAFLVMGLGMAIPGLLGFAFKGVTQTRMPA